MLFVFSLFLLITISRATATTTTTTGKTDRIGDYTPVTRHAYPPFGLKKMALTKSIWIILIRQGEPRLSTIEEALNTRLQSDNCYLLNSDNGKSNLLMEIYCNQVTSDNETVVDYDSSIIPFTHTLDYLLLFFRRASIMIEMSVIVRFPSFRYDDRDTTTLFDGRGGGGTGDNENGVMSVQDFFNSIHESDMYRSKERPTPLNRMVYSADFLQNGVTWGLDRIDQRGDIRDGQYNFNTYAEDVDVYVVDTGINVGHDEFEGRALFYYNSIDNINDDCLGHGTHVAGIVGSRSYGVAKNVTLIAIKVLDCSGTGSTFTIIAGLNAVVNRATQTGKRSVINLSLGGDKSAILDSVIQDIALYHNIVVVVAAGNDGDDACNYSPSNLGQSDTILVVSASDSNDMKPMWANKGACVDLTAPGLSILSTWKGSASALATISGTSMACPFGAGVAALVLQQKPTITVSDACSLIRNSATPNVVAGASSVGGGKNLLYSLVDPNTIIPTNSPPTPSFTPPPPPPAPINLDNHSGLPHRMTIALLLPLIIGLFYLC